MCVERCCASNLATMWVHQRVSFRDWHPWEDESKSESLLSERLKSHESEVIYAR